MSHQSGIQSNSELQSFFANKSDAIRLIKVQIKDENLVLSHTDPPSGDWKSDFDVLIKPHLNAEEACYLLYRLDSCNELGHEWVFILWVPNTVPVRQKMLYASTRSTLRREFGDSHIIHDLHGLTADDVSLEGYKKHLVSKSAPPPLTVAEIEKNEIKMAEMRQTGLEGGHQTMKGIDFPLSNNLIGMIDQFVKERCDYIQLLIDTSQETIELGNNLSQLSPNELSKQMPEDNPCYHLYRYKHTFNNEHISTVIFIYSMPGYKCSIKERMLYSTCKAALLSRLEDSFKISIDKKLEVENNEELSADTLFKEVHPEEVDTKVKFSKPKPPGGRGTRRLIKD